MSLLFHAGEQFFDNSAAVLNGGLLYFYAAGTSTPRNTYSDYDLATANANPVVLDSSGRVGAIYGLNNSAYKIVLKTSAGVTLSTDDNFYGGAQEDRSLALAVTKLSGTQALTGSGDESVALQAVIDNASVGLVVDLMGRTIECDAGLTLPSNIIIQNGTLDFSGCESEKYITIEGSVGTPQSLSVNCTQTGATLASAINAVAGGLVLVYAQNSTLWTPAGVSQTIGELLRVKLGGSTTFSTDGIINEYASYTTANSSQAAVVTAREGVILRNLKIIGKKSATTNTKVVSIRHADRVTIEDCVFDGFDTYAVAIVGSVNCRVRGCTFANGDNGSVCVGFGNYSRDCSVERCHIRGPESSTQTDGCVGVNIGYSESTYQHVPARNIRVDCCEMYAYRAGVRLGQFQNVSITDNDFGYSGTGGNGAAVDSDNACAGRVSITRNRVEASDYSAFYLLMDPIVPQNGHPPQINIDDNIIDWAGTSAPQAVIGVTFGDNAAYAGNDYRLSIRRNELHNSIRGVLVSYGSLGSCAETAIEHNIIDNAGDSANDVAISVAGSGPNDSDMISIVGNKIREGAIADYMIRVVGTFEHVRISDNELVGDPATGAIYLQDFGESAGADLLRFVQICRNTIDIVDGIGITIEDASLIHVDGNIIDTTGNGIVCTLDYASASGFAFTNNTLNAPAVGIAFTTTSARVATGVTISGNRILESSSFCIDLAGDVAGLVVSGNILNRANDTAEACEFDGTGASSISGFAFTGNVVNNGTYGATVTNDTDSIEDGNAYTGQATGTTTGFSTNGDLA